MHRKHTHRQRALVVAALLTVGVPPAAATAGEPAIPTMGIAEIIELPAERLCRKYCRQITVYFDGTRICTRWVHPKHQCDILNPEHAIDPSVHMWIAVPSAE